MRFFNDMYEFIKKAYFRVTDILTNPANSRAVVAIIILVGFVLLAMSFGVIK